MNPQTNQSSIPPDRIRGKLKIFLGMCAGVGKTYSILKEAQQRLSEGIDIVIGYVETHHRLETEALVQGITIVPRKKIEYRGIMLEEMDIDAILARRPALAIIDELPHTNAIGSRHPKRYQDVLELLDAGIDIYTALNVQHIESRADVVQGITTVMVRETVPDSILDLAEDIQLIDITPEDLRMRLAEGKVYLGDKAATAADNFFRIENLLALREIAMRIMAEKTGRDVRDAMAEHHIHGPWKSSERFMVAVGPSPFSEPLIRWTRRTASSTQSPWIAVHVDRSIPLSNEEKQRLSHNLSLVRQLGGETVTIVGEDVAGAILQVANEKNVTQIVIGKPLESPLVRFFTGRSVVDKLIMDSGDIDVTVVRAEKKASRRKQPIGALGAVLPFSFRELATGCGIIFALTCLFWPIRGLVSYSTIALFYLLSIVVLAAKLRRAVVLCVAILSGFLWNFLFIPPVFTLRIGRFDDIVMFCMYIAVALIISSLTSRLRSREVSERMRERRTKVLYQLAQCVVESRTLDEGIRLAVAQIDSIFDCRTAVTLVGENGVISDIAHPASTMQPDLKESGVVAWVNKSLKPAGRFTDTLPESHGIHIPLQTTHGCVGVLSLLPTENAVLDVGQHELLETVADHVAALIDRYNLVRQANRSLIAAESEKLQHVLFDCVSHELKTPLAILSTAVGQIGECLDKGNASQALAAREEATIAIRRLRRSVENLLGMTRMESGYDINNAVWCDLEEIIASSREQVADVLNLHPIAISIPDNLPMIRADPVLLTHVIANLLTNAAQYSPGGSGITLAAAVDDDHVIFRVIDEGEGVPEEDLAGKLFEKFHRGRNAKPGGTGLGLSIVSRFMQLVGGTVTAENNPDGSGAAFILKFPIEVPTAAAGGDA